MEYLKHELGYLEQEFGYLKHQMGYFRQDLGYVKHKLGYMLSEWLLCQDMLS